MEIGEIIEVNNIKWICVKKITRRKNNNLYELWNRDGNRIIYTEIYENN